jgi:hypothetical protein
VADIINGSSAGYDLHVPGIPVHFPLNALNSSSNTKEITTHKPTALQMLNSFQQLTLTGMSLAVFREDPEILDLGVRLMVSTLAELCDKIRIST